ncbi:MAG: hypothetical protein ACJ75J_05685 [Cytophagaceae bacterium]
MKRKVMGLMIGLIGLVTAESFGQMIASAEKGKSSDSTQIKIAGPKMDSLPSRVYNDLPRMPKKKEPARKLYLDEKRGIKKEAVTRKYKHERRSEARVIKRQDKKHGIMAERKRKDKMVKSNRTA